MIYINIIYNLVIIAMLVQSSEYTLLEHQKQAEFRSDFEPIYSVFKLIVR